VEGGKGEGAGMGVSKAIGMLDSAVVATSLKLLTPFAPSTCFEAGTWVCTRKKPVKTRHPAVDSAAQQMMDTHTFIIV